MEAPAHRAGIARLDPLPGETIIDIGCGPGAALSRLGRAVGPTGIVMGIDLSPAMCNRARDRLSRKGISHGGVVEASATCLPVATDSADACFISFLLDLLSAEQIADVLAEVNRILTTGGRVCVIALSASQSTPMVRAYKGLRRRGLQSILDCRPIQTASIIRRSSYTIQSSDQIRVWGLPIDLIVATPTSREY